LVLGTVVPRLEEKVFKDEPSEEELFEDKLFEDELLEDEPIDEEEPFEDDEFAEEAPSLLDEGRVPQTASSESHWLILAASPLFMAVVFDAETFRT
jgi:hypothetical protein